MGITGQNSRRDMVEVAALTEDEMGRGLSPESLLERLGFPRSQQHKQVQETPVCLARDAAC